MAELGLVHLVRAQNGLEPFESFLASYRAHPCGVPHELLLVFKGFAPDANLTPYHALLAGLSYRTLTVADEEFDIGPYFAAARAFDHEYFCFLNSFSVILADDWLGALYRHSTRPGVGLVGATGSHESIYTCHLQAWPWTVGTKRLSRLYLAGLYYGWRELWQLRADFAPFPNPHVRTNAFILPRHVISRLKLWPLQRKADAERFESGRHGLTHQVLDMNLATLVVGRDGQAYAPAHWRASRTFRGGEQTNLLVADNRTRQYAQADPATKRALAQQAWGACAE
ncbi:MAG TPA: hypothetical protein VF525_15630 [Pyrinomonadaceae bacterium]|jgi:hypothetical protein